MSARPTLQNRSSTGTISIGEGNSRVSLPTEVVRERFRQIAMSEQLSLDLIAK